MGIPHKLLITYRLSETQLDRIKNASDDVVITYLPDPQDVTHYLRETEILFGDIPKDRFLQMPNLRWVQISTVGADRFLYPEFLRSNVVLCCSRGMHKYQMAELLFGLMLSIARKLYDYHELQKRSEWTGDLIKESDMLVGRRLGIAGLGSIGSHIAKVAKSFGMEVVGTKNTPAVVECVDEVYGPAELEKLLRTSDHVVNVTPLTPATTKMFGEKEFSLMKPTAVFYNLGRGASVDADALAAALEKGTIKAAALDTFESEPLAQESPLWRTKNLFITPHVGGPIPRYNHFLTEIFIDNLRRFLDGRPFGTAVDKRKGY
ncbi:MAG TPA: D-2-hydroxyacid dehydrogenase [Bacteroidota bacterium]|nr:D-2-hydroxyacid dehydrogenase [Bacteroidota bacterium]